MRCFGCLTTPPDWVLSNQEILKSNPKEWRAQLTQVDRCRPRRASIVQHDWKDRWQFVDTAVIDEKIHVKVGDVVQHPQRHERVNGGLKLDENINIDLTVLKLDFVD